MADDASRGAPPTRARKLPVPDVAGLGLATAETVLATAGFRDVRYRLIEAYAPGDQVVAQAPERGSLHDSHAPVTLSVARQSLVRFLPTAFRPQTPDQPHFLRDFLWIFQHVQDGVTRRIDRMHTLFHPHTTPVAFLPWLASWFAIAFDEDMDERHRRRLLREAAQLFRIRGTKQAILRMVKLFTGLDVAIEENRWPYRGFRVGVSSTVGIDTMILPEVSMAHTFVVRLPVPFDEVGEEKLVRLHRVLEAEKPAGTNYFLQFTGEEGVTEVVGMRVGVSSMIGADLDQGPDQEAVDA